MNYDFSNPATAVAIRRKRRFGRSGNVRNPKPSWKSTARPSLASTAIAKTATERETEPFSQALRAAG